MTREKYINLQYDNNLHYWSNIAIGLGSLVVLALLPIDYLVAPTYFKDFLLYRCVVSCCFFALYFINRRKTNRKLQSLLSIIAGTLVAIMIALMIEKIGGHQSVSFAGIILLTIYVFGLIPFTLSMSVLAALIIYGIYAAPILIYDNINL